MLVIGGCFWNGGAERWMADRVGLGGGDCYTAVGPRTGMEKRDTVGRVEVKPWLGSA